ncbi:MAG: alpha/beta fold hydrolase [Pseudomonadota bacterium]|nr:alpha/beta fold hydrolase [Pseudomonadota bacterium]
MTSSPTSDPAVDFLADGPADAAVLIVLAHGAGAPMDSPFMAVIADGLAAAGHRVLRFEFPYMARRRATGVKAPPDRQDKLLASWRAALDQAPPHPRRFIAGKSMGGRMATLLAADAEAPAIDGVICLGYPFHAPGKPTQTRTAHLSAIACPTLILQGERDPMGNRAMVEALGLRPPLQLAWLPDGNHDFTPRKAAGVSAADNLAAALAHIDGFIARG